MPDLSKTATDAVSMAREAGAADVWASAGRSRSTEFRVRNGKLEQVQENTSASVGIRLFVDGRYSSHSTNDLRSGELRRFITEAVALTRYLQPDPHRKLADPELYAGRSTEDLELADPSLTSLGREARLRYCQEMNARVVGKDRVISGTSGFSDGAWESAAASSNGFSGHYGGTSVGMSTSVTLEGEGDRRPEMGLWCSAHHAADLMDPKELADRALERAYARLGATKGKSRRATMVVDAMAAGSLVGRLLRPASGGAVQQGRSLFAGKVGQRLFSKKLTIIDEPLRKRGLGSRPYDAEGIAARARPIVEAGTVRNLYLDTYYASKLGVTPTTGGGTNRVVALGKRDLTAILRAVGKGIYVTQWMGGNADPTTGDFSFGIRGHEIKNGKVGAPIGEMNVTGNLVDLFANLREVGNDPWPYSSTLAPTMAFDRVEFSGS